MGKYVQRVQNPERIKPIPPDRLQSDYGDLLKSLPGKAFHDKRAPHNVFGVVVLRPEMAKVFLPYFVRSKTCAELSVKEQELLILRMACIFGSDYVWGHHVPLAKDAGMSEETIALIPFPIEQGRWDEKNNAYLRAVDELAKKANLSEENWKRVSKFYTKEQILDMLFIISQYHFFCSINNTFGIKLETPELPHLPDA